MVIRSFKDKNVEAFFKSGFRVKRKGWIHLSAVVRRKLDMLNYAKELRDLKNPPNNRLESLKGNYKEFYSIRINDQWRIIFKWDNQPYDVQIVDYH